MTALLVTIGFAVGAAMVYLLLRPVRVHLERELAYYRKELATAQDRLLHAWRDDKAIIPPRPLEIRAPEKLPVELQAVVDEWEDPESRAVMEQKVRNLHFARGLGVMGVLKALEDEHP